MTDDIEEVRDQLAASLNRELELEKKLDHAAEYLQEVTKRADTAEAKWSAAQAEIVKLSSWDSFTLHDMGADGVLDYLRRVIE